MIEIYTKQVGGYNVTIREIDGLKLVSRQDFMTAYTTRRIMERLLKRGELTRYLENGKEKQPVNGKYRPVPTYYDLKEYEQADLNLI